MKNKKNHPNSLNNLATLGNFTKAAVETFENNIVNKENYLEEVENTLENVKKNK